MSSVKTILVESRRQLREFVDFPEKIYRHNKYYAPPIRLGEFDTLDKKRNPAADFCDFALYLAVRDGKVVGRVAAIVNRRANEQWNHKEVRFGWLDFFDDPEISAALMERVYEFGRQYGMEYAVGPLGFTDFDPEGMLVEGFDSLSTMPLIYNEPYYPEHMEAMGFEKDADWLEYKLFVPEQLPEKITRVAKIVSERHNLRSFRLSKRLIRKENYAHKIFNLINECYKNLYNYTVMPENLADKYIGFYLSVLDPKFVTLVENEKKELIAFGIVMPSLVKALQKCRGRLLPFGWLRLLKAMTMKNEGIEMLLVGVRPDYQNSGANSLLFANLFPEFLANGAKWAESSAILETNLKSSTQMTIFEHECKKRRRSYKKAIEY